MDGATDLGYKLGDQDASARDQVGSASMRGSESSFSVPRVRLGTLGRGLVPSNVCEGMRLYGNELRDGVVGETDTALVAVL